MREVLALEEDARAAERLRQPPRLVERRRTPDVVAQQTTRGSIRNAASCRARKVGALELLDRARRASRARTGRRRRRSSRARRGLAVRMMDSWKTHAARDRREKRLQLSRDPYAGRRLDAGRHIDHVRPDLRDRVPHVRRVQPARQNDRAGEPRSTPPSSSRSSVPCRPAERDRVRRAAPSRSSGTTSTADGLEPVRSPARP